MLSLDDFSGVPASAAGEPEEEHLSTYQLQLLSDLSKNSTFSAWFWAMSDFTYLLAKWARWLSGVLHGCPCHSYLERKDLAQNRETCPLTGRTGVLLASGLPQLAVEELNKLGTRVPSHCRQSLQALSNADPESAQRLTHEFQMAVAKLRFRVQQNFSYWRDLPWSLLMLVRPFFQRFDNAAAAAKPKRLIFSISCQRDSVEICGSLLSPGPSRSLRRTRASAWPARQHCCSSRSTTTAPTKRVWGPAA